MENGRISNIPSDWTGLPAITAGAAHGSYATRNGADEEQQFCKWVTPAFSPADIVTVLPMPAKGSMPMTEQFAVPIRFGNG